MGEGRTHTQAHTHTHTYTHTNTHALAERQTYSRNYGQRFYQHYVVFFSSFFVHFLCKALDYISATNGRRRWKSGWEICLNQPDVCEVGKFEFFSIERARRQREKQSW